MSRDRAFANFDTFIRLYTGHVAERELRELNVVMADGPCIAAQLRALETTFKLRLDRLNRVRNAAQHGGPIEMEACHGLGSFALTIGHWANHIVIEAILAGREPNVAAQERRDRYENLIVELQDGANPARLWA